AAAADVGRLLEQAPVHVVQRVQLPAGVQDQAAGRVAPGRRRVVQVGQGVVQVVGGGGVGAVEPLRRLQGVLDLAVGRLVHVGLAQGAGQVLQHLAGHVHPATGEF